MAMAGAMVLVAAACASDGQPIASPDDAFSPTDRSPSTTLSPQISTPVAQTSTSGEEPSSSVASAGTTSESETTDARPLDSDGLDEESLTESDDPDGALLDVIEAGADEPTFDIGPPVAIDVDLARFPIDDAGIGGPSTAGDDAEGSDEQVVGWAAVDRYLESALIVPGNTAASVAVSIGGDVVHTAAFGVRDPTVGDVATPADRFRIASISKPITAIVAMVLVEDGVIGLDDPVGQIIADHVGLEEISAGTEQLTLRGLLSHRTGFAKFASTFFRNGADGCTDAARQGLSRGSSGGGYIYSNMNYCLAGLLIEALTGLSYEQAAYRYLLTPLGISGMRLPPTVDPGPGEIQHQTTPGRNYMETLGAAGSWIATPADLVTILDSLDLSTPGFKPLSQDAVFEMAVPAAGAYGQRGYGLGLISYGDGRFGHTGTIESTHAMLLNRGDSVTWALTVAGQSPSDSTSLERIMNRAFEAGGFT